MDMACTGSRNQRGWVMNYIPSDEIERLQKESDLWRNICIKLIGMILPYSLLMRDDERKELATILKEAVDG